MENSNKFLVETAVRPFSDNAELKLSATDFLLNRVTENADAATYPGRTTYEYKVTVQMRKELREVLGYDRRF